MARLARRKRRAAGGLRASVSRPKRHRENGRAEGLQVEDILDAAAACWSAGRLAAGHGRKLPEIVKLDSTGLPMASWW
jgi:predicted RNase H-like nuclease